MNRGEPSSPEIVAAGPERGRADDTRAAQAQAAGLARERTDTRAAALPVVVAGRGSQEDEREAALPAVTLAAAGLDHERADATATALLAATQAAAARRGCQEGVAAAGLERGWKDTRAAVALLAATSVSMEQLQLAVQKALISRPQAGVHVPG